jgi:hypothetical protein
MSSPACAAKGCEHATIPRAAKVGTREDENGLKLASRVMTKAPFGQIIPQFSTRKSNGKKSLPFDLKI